MRVRHIDVTAVGKVVVEKQAMLKVTGTKSHFILVDDPNAKPKNDAKTPLARLLDAARGGEKVVSVTGRLDGWRGPFPQLLGKLPKKPRTIVVKEFKLK